VQRNQKQSLLKLKKLQNQSDHTNHHHRT
jgi:hypothetical protein